MAESIHALETRLNILTQKAIRRALTLHGKDIVAFNNREEIVYSMCDSVSSEERLAHMLRLFAWNDAPTHELE